VLGWRVAGSARQRHSRRCHDTGGRDLGRTLQPAPTANPAGRQPTIKLNGKIKNSGKTKIKVPIKLTFKIPAGATGAEACAIKPTISVKTSKKKTVKVKAKLKLKSGSCTYAGSIKLPKSLKGKKVKFSIAVPEGAATAKTTASKTLKLK
jgi:hypothetical protein